MRRAICLIVAMFVLGAWGLAQTAQTSASLSGRVLTTDAPPQPVRRAIVTLTGSEILTNLSAITDDQGRFAFPQLRPGRYTVSASKIVYLTTAYGAKRPGRPGTTVTLTAGQNLRDLTIPLARGAVITGVVRDQTGEPASNVQVTVSRTELLMAIGGELSRFEPLMTDDRGVYRAYGLAPGEYVVSAVPGTSSVANVLQLSRRDLDNALASLQQRARGNAPATAGATSPLPALTAGTFAYAPIYFPGTPIASDATRIRVAAGDERGGVDVALTLVSTSRIDGTVSMSDGSAVPVVRVSLTPLGPPSPLQFSPRLTRSPGQPHAFSYGDLTPGRYLLLARAGAEFPPEGISPIASAGLLERSVTDTYFAMTEISLNGQNLSGIGLTLRPLMSLSGRVAFETASATTTTDPANVKVGLAPANPAGTGLTYSGPVSVDLGVPSPVSVGADGMFRVKSILPGGYVVAATVPGAASATGWRLKSAIVNGRDVLDDPIVFDANGGEVTGAVVTFSDRHSEIAGRLQTPSGDPASEYVVVIFPTERERWRPGARRIQSTRPASDGRFSVADLPAGDYLIAALTDVEPNEWQDPAFLEQLVPAAFKVTLADGGRVLQDLQIKR